MKKIILAVCILFFAATGVEAMESFKDELFIKTETVEITNMVRETEMYRGGWYYGLVSTDFQVIKEIVEYVGKEYEQLKPWQFKDGSAYISYKINDYPVIVYVNETLIIVAK